MAAKKNFDIGDLVWAKLKGFPFWPAKIVEPPTDVKSTPKKARHYVFFFGSQNYAWIQDENIIEHSEKMLQSTSSKKKSSVLKLAIKQITEEALKMSKSLVKGKKSPEASTSNTEKKIARVQRKKVKVGRKKVKAESQKVRKKVVPKRRAKKESEYDSTRSNVNNNHVAVIRPYDCTSSDSTDSSTSSGITWHDDFPLPTFDLHAPSTSVKTINIQPSHLKIGFIGLGMMGQRLVKNLLTSKHKVTIWNRTPEKCVAFTEIGAELAENPSDLVEKCDIIFCCVSGPEASKSLVFGDCGILSGLEKSPPGSKSYVEMTTLDPTTSIDNAEAIIRKGGKYLEAPFIGSRTNAENGSLLIVTAGDKEVFESSESCFSTFSLNAYYLSPIIGNGSKMNLIHRMLLGVSSVALAEAMTLVENCNIPLINFFDIMKLGPASSPFIIEKGRAIMSSCFQTNTTLKYQQRDIALALSLDKDSDDELPMTVSTAANEVFKRAQDLNFSEYDVSAVYLEGKY